MKIIQINPQNPEKSRIEHALKVLENDGVIIYPTDTIYGMGANIYSDNAIHKVYSIKKRSYNKPLSVCISKIKDIDKIAYLNDEKDLIKKILPGPFTIILNKKEHVSPILNAGGKKIGIRIPDNKICRELTSKFPITSTSANISGEPVPKSVEEITEQVSEQVDLIIDSGKADGIPSTVLDCTISPPKILRKGAGELKYLTNSKNL
ncbi:MAG TPA: L-threonylcarbamoyladenylate synthase [Methanobacterium sp.]|nr:L-threonylcarbamoyladenylate synthase [Methanobacterium sp.]